MVAFTVSNLPILSYILLSFLLLIKVKQFSLEMRDFIFYFRQTKTKIEKKNKKKKMKKKEED